MEHQSTNSSLFNSEFGQVVKLTCPSMGGGLSVETVGILNRTALDVELEQHGLGTRSPLNLNTIWFNLQDAVVQNFFSDMEVFKGSAFVEFETNNSTEKFRLKNILVKKSAEIVVATLTT